MSWQVHPKEMASVLALSSQERYGYFIKKVADFEEAWGLQSEDGWVLVGFDGDQGEAFCIWPHADYAQACVIEGWNDCAPELISLQELLEELLPALLRDGKRIAVFPTPGGQAVVVDPRDLQSHLEHELEQS